MNYDKLTLDLPLKLYLTKMLRNDLSSLPSIGLPYQNITMTFDSLDIKNATIIDTIPSDYLDVFGIKYMNICKSNLL